MTTMLASGVSLKKTGKNGQNSDREAYVERYVALCDEVGFDSVKEQFLVQHAKRTAPQRAARIIGRPFSEAEIVLWRHVLPETTHESSFSEFTEGGIVPLPVLERIAEAQRTQIFDHIEIWHKERPNDDPMAVGVVVLPASRKYYSLGRWGDEDSNHTSLKAIKDRVREELEPYTHLLNQKPWEPNENWLFARGCLNFFLWLTILLSPKLLPDSLLSGWWNVPAYVLSFCIATFVALCLSAYLDYKQGGSTLLLRFEWEEKYPIVKKLWPILDQIPDEENYEVAP